MIFYLNFYMYFKYYVLFKYCHHDVLSDMYFGMLWLGRDTVVEYGEHLSRIGRRLFEAMVKKLDLNIEASSSYVAESTGIMRIYRYPKCSNSDVGLGMEVHTDSSVLSILSQENEVSGLELLKDHQWLTVKPVSNTLIVNLGDMMQVKFSYYNLVFFFFLILRPFQSL